MQIEEFNIVGAGQGEQIINVGKRLVDFLKLDSDGKGTLLIRRLTGTIEAGAF